MTSEELVEATERGLADAIVAAFADDPQAAAAWLRYDADQWATPCMEFDTVASLEELVIGAEPEEGDGDIVYYESDLDVPGVDLTGTGLLDPHLPRIDGDPLLDVCRQELERRGRHDLARQMALRAAAAANRALEAQRGDDAPLVLPVGGYDPPLGSELERVLTDRQRTRAEAVLPRVRRD